MIFHLGEAAYIESITRPATEFVTSTQSCIVLSFSWPVCDGAPPLPQLRRDPENMEALQAYSTIDQVRADVRDAQQALHYGDHHTHIALLSRVLEACSWSAPLRELRADSYVAVGDLIAALSDLRATTKLVTDNRAGYLQIAQLHYRLGEAHESLR